MADSYLMGQTKKGEEKSWNELISFAITPTLNTYNYFTLPKTVYNYSELCVEITGTQNVVGLADFVISLTFENWNNTMAIYVSGTVSPGLNGNFEGKGYILPKVETIDEEGYTIFQRNNNLNDDWFVRNLVPNTSTGAIFIDRISGDILLDNLKATIYAYN